MSDIEGDAAPPAGSTQTGKALVLVIVVALIAVLVLRHTGPTGAAKAATPVRPEPTTTTTAPRRTVTPRPPTTTTTVPLVLPGDIKVEVLNGLQAGRLATNLATRLRAGGYQTLAPDNTTAPTSTSVIYLARRGYYPEARKLAVTLGLAPGAIQRRLPPTAPVPAGLGVDPDLIVVIGTSLESLASSP